MKTIHVDDDLYNYIASQTRHIGESASDILRRMLSFPDDALPMPQQSEIKLTTDKNRPEEKNLFKEIKQLLASKAYRSQKKVVVRFMQLLSMLYQFDAEVFEQAATSLHGRTRRYFAKEQKILLANGNHTRPCQVPNTPLWVITNTNSERKRMMIRHIMQRMQFSQQIIDSVCDTL